MPQPVTPLPSDSETPIRRCTDCAMRSHGILREIPDEAFERISCCMTPHRYPARHHLFLEGNPATHLACIRSGVVKISKVGPVGRMQIVGVVGQGFFLGHEALLNEPYRSTVETLTDACVCTTTPQILHAQIQRFPDVGLGLTSFMCHRIQELEAMVLRLGTLSTRARVAAHLIMYLRPQHGTTGPGSFLPLPLSRQDLADSLGMAKETLIRHLSRLAKDETIAIDGVNIRILNAARLRRVAAVDC